MKKMRPFGEMPAEELAGIGYVLTDIDDTLTTEGRFPASSLLAMERLEAGESFDDVLAARLHSLDRAHCLANYGSEA